MCTQKSTKKSKFFDSENIISLQGSLSLRRDPRASLVVQWLRIRLPMQGTRVRALVREDPTCCRAPKPREPQLLSLRSRARETQLLSPRAATTEACTPRARALQQEKPLQ